MDGPLPLPLEHELGSGSGSCSGSGCHIVALPYPGRGHVNPMMNLCSLLAARCPNLLITFVVTEEWLLLISSEPKPDNVRFATIPNVIPSEKVRANDFLSFVKAVMTKMESPFERLLDHLQPPVNSIIADTYLFWAVRVGNKRKIPVASLWPMSASVFTLFHHFPLLLENNHFPLDLSKRGGELVDYIPGLPPTRADDLTTVFDDKGRDSVGSVLECFAWVPRAQSLLFTTFHELDASVIHTLKSEFSFPVYNIGPLIPFMRIKNSLSPTEYVPEYILWLDSQPTASVLYISLGSFLSVSMEQIREVVAGVHESGVKFLCVSRGSDSWTQDGHGHRSEDRSRVVPWCDQLKVLSHPAVGGFWTHCGLNSTLEAIYSGVPMLAFPIWWDQVSNAKQIEQDWKVGWRVKKRGNDPVVPRDRVAELVRRFMNLEDGAGKDTRSRAQQLGEGCRSAIQVGGTSYRDLGAFVENFITRN